MIDLTLFTDPLHLPNLLEPSYALMARISFYVLSTFFIVATLHESLQVMTNESNYAGLFVRSLLVLSLLILYERFFIWIVYGMDLIAEAIMPHEEFQGVIKVFFNQPLDWKYLWKLDARISMTVMNYITYSLAFSIFGALMIIRYALLGVLYILGPLVISIGIYKATSEGLSAWMRSLVAIGSWKLLFSILMKVISTMNLQAAYLGVDTVNGFIILMINLAFLVLFIMVPFLTSQFIAGKSIGAVGSVTLGAATALTSRFMMQLMIPSKKTSFGGSVSTPSNQGGSTYK